MHDTREDYPVGADEEVARRHRPMGDAEIATTGPWAGAHESAMEALRITQHDRNDKAGDPEDNFDFIAIVWSALLHAAGVLPRDKRLTAKHVGWLMIGLKACRDMHISNRDNRTDTHGYALCIERVDPTER